LYKSPGSVGARAAVAVRAVGPDGKADFRVSRGADVDVDLDRDRALLLLGLVLVALNFRPAVTSVPPVLETVRVELGLSYAAASLLTTVPTVLIGLFAFPAAAISGRLGRERTILWAVVLITVGTALRAVAGTAVVLFGTTVAVGIGIAVSQALVPSVVSERFADRAPLVTGLYTTSLGLGAAVAAGVTAPLAGVVGWPAALGSWALLGVLALAVWLPTARDGPAAAADRGRLPWTGAGAWLLTLFFSAQTLLYFAELTWIAPIYVDLGWTSERAGFLLTLLLSTQLVGSLAIPATAGRWADRRPWLALTITANAAGLAGLALVPLALPWGWATLAGVGCGGAFSLCMTLPIDHAAGPGAADRLTAMMTGVGYTVGAAGPLAVGSARDLLGGYRLPVLALAALAAVMLVAVPWFVPGRTILGPAGDEG
jgi:CP family cyanate transporter-like MFS transporter